MISSKKRALENKNLRRSESHLIQLKKNSPENFDKIFHNNNSSTKFSTVKNLRILVICYDAIGDFILSTRTLQHLARLFPGSKVDLLVSPRNIELARTYSDFSQFWSIDLNNPNGELSTSELKLIQGAAYDLILNLFNKPSLYALEKISFLVSDQSTYLSVPYRYKDAAQFLFLKQHATNYIEADDKKHFTAQMNEILSILQNFLLKSNCASADFEKLNPDLVEKTYYLPPQLTNSATQHFQKTDKTRVLFNPLGSQKGNTLNFFKTLCCIYSFSKKSNIELFMFSAVLKKWPVLQKIFNINFLKSDSIIEAIQFTNEMDLIVTTDTSIMHIATALNKKLVVLKNNESWREQFDPIYGSYKIVKSSEKNISKFQSSALSNALDALLNKSKS